jgi:hypothetical protein
MRYLMLLVLYFSINIGLASIADYYTPGHGRMYWFVIFCAMDGVFARAELGSLDKKKKNYD